METIKKNQKLILTITGCILVLVFASAGAYYYYVIRKNTATADQLERPNQANPQNRTGRMNTTTLEGTVIRIDEQIAVLDTADQGQRILQLSDTTPVIKTTSASRDEVLVSGKTVTITLKDPQATSLSAQSMTLSLDRSAMRVNGSDIPRGQTRPQGGNAQDNPTQRMGNQMPQNQFTDPNTLIGTIQTIDAQAITLQTFTNETKTIMLTDTTYLKQVSLTRKDLQTGYFIKASGTVDANGSMKPRSIQIEKEGTSS